MEKILGNYDFFLLSYCKIILNLLHKSFNNIEHIQLECSKNIVIF